MLLILNIVIDILSYQRAGERYLLSSLLKTGYTSPQRQVFSTDVLSAAAKSLQLCPTLCDLIGSHSPGSPIPGILQARTLEWVAISFSNTCK